MISEIFLEGYRLDLTKDMASLLTFAIDDVKDFSTRSTTYSQQVVLPGTANNNAVFGNIFDTGISNDYDSSLDNVGYNYNSSKSAKCIIFQDNLQTFKGTLRLIEIDKIDGYLTYQAALNGDLTTLNVALSSGYLTDLDFSAYNLIWNAANISASWDNTPGSGVFFPLMDYGTYSQGKHNWDFHTLRPSLYVKEYIDKMFSAADFRYECDLFNTDRFKSLVVPHNQKVLQSQVSRILTASQTGSHTLIDSGIGITTNNVPWDTYLAGGFSYSPLGFTYTAAPSLSINLTWEFAGDRFSTTNGNFEITIKKNGAILANTNILTFPVHQSYTWSGAVTTSIATGDFFEIIYTYGGTGTDMVVTIDNTGSFLQMDATTVSLQPVALGQLITINDALPQNIRQVDFLVSVVKLFNLYVYEDQFDERLIKIAPFVDFYSTDFNDSRDWTYKLNRRKPIKIKPLSEVNSKLYNFNYKDDSDYYNDQYKKRYNQGYGSYIFDSEFEFASQTNTLELVFAATPIVGYEGEEKVYSTIFKRTGDIAGTGEETIDSVIRILQSKKVHGVTSWQILDAPNTGTVLGSYVNYGYAGHFDDPDSPTNDLNFGALKQLFFILVTGDLTKTQFNVYWSAYMNEITDKDSKLLTANFYLTPKDIFDLDFSRYIVVDGVLFRLNKITDYNASAPGDCEVELLKAINTSYTYTTFPPVADSFYILWDVGQRILWNSTDKIEYK